MRPRYESQNDIRIEREAASHIEDYFNCSVVRNKPLYCADFTLLKNNRVIAIGEIKKRNNSVSKYNTLMISADKIHNCIQFSKTFNIPMILFVWWTEGIHALYNIENIDSIGIGGRYDRNDAADIEPVVHYNTSRFKLIVPL